MDLLSNILQLIFGIFYFLVPGMAVIYILNGNKAPSWPFAFILSLSFILSSLIISALQFLTINFLTKLYYAPIYIFLFLTLVYFCFWGYKIFIRSFSNIGKFELYSLIVLFCLVLSWVSIMHLSPYPSHITLQLGDPPVYYRIAQNLSEGKGWTPDFFIGDYIGGMMSYVFAKPILILITVFFFNVFKSNWYSLYIYNALAGVILVYLLSTVVCYNLGKKLNSRILFFVILFALVPTHFILFGLGVITSSSALSFLLITALLIAPFSEKKLKFISIGALLVFLFWVRPESALLVISIILVYSAFFLLSLVKNLKNKVIICLVAVFISISAFMLWASIPNIADNFPPAWKGLGIFYIKYDDSAMQFKPMYTPWLELNHKLSRANFSGEDVVKSAANLSIVREIQSHPFIFLLSVFNALPSTAQVFVHAISFPYIEEFGFAEFSSLVIFFVMIVFIFLEPKNRPISFILVFFLLVLPLFNIAPGVRHLLPVSVVILGLFFRSVMEKFEYLKTQEKFIYYRKHYILVIVAIFIFFFILDSFLLVDARTSSLNRSYIKIIDDIKKVTGPEDIIASSYPQLITCATGRRSIGATWLTENLDLIVEKQKPDFILIDDARDGSLNYTLFANMVKKGWRLNGYVPIVYNQAGHYIILRSASYNKEN